MPNTCSKVYTLTVGSGISWASSSFFGTVAIVAAGLHASLIANAGHFTGVEFTVAGSATGSDPGPASNVHVKVDYVLAADSAFLDHPGGIASNAYLQVNGVIVASDNATSTGGVPSDPAPVLKIGVFESDVLAGQPWLVFGQIFGTNVDRDPGTASIALNITVTPI